MKKVFAGAVLAVGLMVGSVLGQCNTTGISAVTGPTGNFNVTGGKVCPDSVVLNWTFGSYTNGSIEFWWGLSNDALTNCLICHGQTPTQNSDYLNVTVNKAKLAPLKPDTKYYYKVISNYNGGRVLINTTNTKNSFKTETGTFISKPIVEKPLINKTVATNVAIYLPSGKILANCEPNKVKQVSNTFGKGIYLVKYYSKNNVMIGSELVSN